MGTRTKLNISWIMDNTRVGTEQYVHFIAIGGIGMSALAEILCKRGISITGCDRSSNSNTERLLKMGVKVRVGHGVDHINKNVALVVVSGSIPSDCSEVMKAKELGIPILHRAELLAEIMKYFKSSVAIAGSHGKTTITSMLAALFDTAGLDPTTINGGVMNQFGSNAVLGKDLDWVIAEADESDGSFLKLPPSRICVISNVDLDHMEYFGSEEQLKSVFMKFIQNITKDGVLIVCGDCPRLRQVVEIGLKLKIVKIFFYGIFRQQHSDAINIHASNIRFTESGMLFDVNMSGCSGMPSLDWNWKDFMLSAYGEYNVQNSLVLIAVASFLGLDQEMVRKTLANFKGTQRRFALTGTWENNVQIFNDYAHHPAEIAAVLKSAKQICKGRLIAVHQPHRNSRLADTFQEYSNCFSHADEVILLPVYEPSGKKLGDLTSELAKVIYLKSANARLFQEFKEVAQHLIKTTNSEDLVICMGAGTINELASNLGKLQPTKQVCPAEYKTKYNSS